MTGYLLIFAVGFCVYLLYRFARSRNPWKVLLAYSSIATKILISLIFLDLVLELRFVSAMIIIFLLLNLGGTMIAAYFLGVKR